MANGNIILAYLIATILKNMGHSMPNQQRKMMTVTDLYETWYAYAN